MQPIVQIHTQRAPGDCGICALAMYLGRSYEDILAASVSVTKRSRIHHTGMFVRDMKRAAKKLGVRLRLQRSIDFDQDEGVLSLSCKEDEHAVLLKAGLIFAGDGNIWEPDVYLAATGYRPISLLVRTED